MSKYEYKFVEVPAKSGLKVKPGDTFEKCKEIIVTQAEDGWRLKQILTPNGGLRRSWLSNHF